MKILHSAFAIFLMFVGALVFPMEKQQSTVALTQPGYNHRLTDGKNTCKRPGADQDKCGHDYLSQLGKGFINQTKEFIDGYVTGFLRHEILEDIREFCAVIDAEVLAEILGEALVRPRRGECA
jgi:hypothetical protein